MTRAHPRGQEEVEKDVGDLGHLQLPKVLKTQGHISIGTVCTPEEE